MVGPYFRRLLRDEYTYAPSGAVIPVPPISASGVKLGK